MSSSALRPSWKLVAALTAGALCGGATTVTATPPGPVAGAFTYVPHAVVDAGGLRHPRTGKFLEAFRMYVPKGWAFKGGIQWVVQQKGPLAMDRQDFAAPVKVAFTVESPDGRCAIQIYPAEKLVDLTGSPAAGMGLFPPGSRYMGMLVHPVLEPTTFVESLVLPYQRGLPRGSFQVLERKALPDVALLFKHEAEVVNRAAAPFGVPIAQLGFRAGAVNVDYQAGSLPVRESFICALSYLAMPGSTLFEPRMCVSLRAPRAEFDGWARRLLACIFSFKVNPVWAVELAKLVDENMRRIGDVDAYCAKLDAEIVANRAKTNLQIHQDFYPRIAPYATVRGADGSEAFMPSGGNYFRNGQTGAIEELPPGGTPEGPGWTPMKEATN